MTMDMLLLDECGQMSSQQLATIDIILRHLRGSTLPFGGVLICGSFDHRQLECIGGLPFLLSSHILTDFTLVKLEQSVRAAKDKKLQVCGKPINFKMLTCLCLLTSSCRRFRTSLD